VQVSHDSSFSDRRAVQMLHGRSYRYTDQKSHAEEVRPSQAPTTGRIEAA